jgi:hypothetical protein
MSALFADPFQQDFANIALGAISVGAADADEIATVAERTTPGDDESFYSAWVAAADGVVAGAGSLEPDAARRAYLRAAVYYSVAWHPFLGPTANDDLTEAFARESQALAHAAARFEPALEAVSIPYPDHDMPGYFVPASRHPAGTCRPLLVCTNGYDGSLSAMLVYSALAASARGYHCLLFDGPGQGAMLIEHGVPLRADGRRSSRPSSTSRSRAPTSTRPASRSPAGASVATSRRVVPPPSTASPRASATPGCRARPTSCAACSRPAASALIRPPTSMRCPTTSSR